MPASATSCGRRSEAEGVIGMSPATLGVIMLDTRFTRFAGDIGHEPSHSGPVLFETVPQASAAAVIGGMAALAQDSARRDAVAPFVAAGMRLVARGAAALTTSCGFLAAFQRELSDALPVPVLTSALCLLDDISRHVPAHQSIGILTFNARALLPHHLAAVGYGGHCVIAGLRPDSQFQNEILEDRMQGDFKAREADVLRAADALVDIAPELGAVLLECTNFPPHRAALEQRLGRPVFDIWNVVEKLTGWGRCEVFA